MPDEQPSPVPSPGPVPSPAELLGELAARGSRLRAPRHALLIEEGETGDSLFIILSGRVRVFAADRNGREVTYGFYGAGDYVGEMSLDGEPRSASVMTLEPTECAVVTRHTLTLFLRERPEFAYVLISRLIRRARSATLSARQIALNDVYGRLVLVLQQMAQPGPDGRPTIPERPTHQALAHHVGASREMVSRLMKDLERGGYILKVGPALVIAKPLPERW